MKLKEYLRAKRIKNWEFAELTGISRSAISNYLRGRRIPNAKNMYIIEQMTRKMVTLKDFVGDD